MRMVGVGDIERAVEDLYDMRRRYFVLHPIEEAGLKERRIKQRVEHITADIAALRLQAASVDQDESSGDIPGRLTNEQQSTLAWLEGKARNATSEFDPLSQEMMTRALKLNPKLGDTSDVHVQLGECFWKKKDTEGAKLSFEQSMKSSDREIVKQGKRNLSIVLRQMAKRQSSKYADYMQESVKVAKEAIALDMKDGTSWYILGNAYLSHFFADGQKQETVKLAMQAYKNAFKDPLSEFNQDLHFNYAILLKFQENYEEAVKSLRLVVKLDPSWTEAETFLKQIETMLLRITDLASNKGGLKPKQYEKIVSKSKDDQLGPYSLPIKDSKTDEQISLTQCSLSDLSQGPNPGKVVLLKVLTELSDFPDQPPYIVIAADSADNTCAISVYNAVSDFHLQRGDSVAVSQPPVFDHDFSVDHRQVKFRSIRVFSPVELVVNGRKTGKNYESYASLGVEAKAS